MNTEEYLRFYSRIRKTFFKEFGYDLFFIGGTLLGYVREKQFLKNDKDMDVAYFSKFKFAHCVRDEMAEIIGRLIELEERVSFIRSNYSVVTNYFRWKDGECRIDVMPYWREGDFLYRPTFVGYESRNDSIILPLMKASFHGHEILIPNNPEIKLSLVYGDDWKVPDPGFDKKVGETPI